MPATPALRREQIKLQVALIDPLLHIKGYAAPETKAAAERARVLIEQAEALAEPLEDPLLLFSVLYGFWVANLNAFNGDAMRELAAQFLALAEQQQTTAPRMIGHRLIGLSLLHTGDIAEGRAHLDQAITLYDPAEHRPLATRFGQDVRVAALSWRSLALWFLGYPKAALADAEHALKDAREIGQAATLMYALPWASFTQTFCGNYATASALADEVSRFGGRKRLGALEGVRNVQSGLCIGPDRPSRGRSPNDHLRTHRTPVNGNNNVDTGVFVIFGEGLCGAWTIR